MPHSKTPTKQSHFKIGGDFVTEHVRNLMFERTWDEGLRFLTDYVIGLGFDLAVDILRGHKRLVGVNTVELDDELPEVRAKLHERLAYQYEGIVFDGSHHFQPYATVNNWGVKDLEHARVHCNPYVGDLVLGGLTPNTMPRNLHYMDNQREDRPIELRVGDDPIMVLWKRVTPPPAWWPRYGTMQWQEALNAYLRVRPRGLDSRGNFQRYGADAQVETLSEEPAITARREDPEESPPPEMPESDRELAGECGYVLPDGRFFSCPYSGHSDLASSLVYHLVNKEEYNPQRRAETLGWVKIAYGWLDRIKDVLILHDVDRKLTRKQSVTVEKWCKKHGEELPYWWDEKAT